MKDDSASNARTLKILSESEMYHDYERAFTEGTGLPLRMHAPELLNIVHYAGKQENSFCSIMAKK